MIQTVRGRGYRFVSPVEEEPEESYSGVEGEPFVGRAQVLQLLEQEFTAARRGRARVVDPGPLTIPSLAAPTVLENLATLLRQVANENVSQVTARR